MTKDPRSSEAVDEESNGGATSELGVRIRSARQQRGLTVAELAARAQVSKSLISQIERGIAAPSVETVRRIASSLELPVFSLFLSDPDSDMVVRAHQRRIVTYPGSKVVREILSPGVHGRMVLLWVTFPPGEQSGVGPVHHIGEESVVVIDGAIEVQMGEERVRLDKGDSMTFDPAIPHMFRNPTDSTTSIVVAISPPSI